jgi:GAF domain-containing protein
LSKRLLDIGFTINRVAVYSVLSALVVGSFILVEYVVSQIMGAGRGANVAAGAALALVLGLSMRFIHRRVDRVLDEVFFRKRHEDERAIRSFAREAEFITDEDLLLDRARSVLEQRADASFVIIALDDGKGDYGEYDENDPAIVALRAWHKPVDLKTLETKIHAEFAYPMIARGRLVGFLALGPKRSGENYAPDESEAIAELAREVGLAVDALRAEAPENALLESLRSVADDIGEMKAMLRHAVREGLRSN